MSAPRTGFAARRADRPRAEILGPAEARQRWLQFLTLARAQGDRATLGGPIDEFDARGFEGFVRKLAAPFPVRSPACALEVAEAAKHLGRAVVNCADAEQRANLARPFLALLDFLDAVVATDIDTRAEFTRRITGESGD